MHQELTIAPAVGRIAFTDDTLYAALPPCAPVFVRAPSFAMPAAPLPPSRSELLRQQIAAARKMRVSTAI